MGRSISGYFGIIGLLVILSGCKAILGPDRTGVINLSSELFGTETYYIFGFSYEKGTYYKYPFQGEPVPDIINEAIRVLEGGNVKLLPGFNTPGQMNGFALAGEFVSLEEANEFYQDYAEVETGLQFETISDTIELFQVWIQQTAIGNYAKLLVRDIQNFEGETGSQYNVVTMDYTYQPNGSVTFSK